MIAIHPDADQRILVDVLPGGALTFFCQRYDLFPLQTGVSLRRWVTKLCLRLSVFCKQSQTGGQHDQALTDNNSNRTVVYCVGHHAGRYGETDNPQDLWIPNPKTDHSKQRRNGRENAEHTLPGDGCADQTRQQKQQQDAFAFDTTAGIKGQYDPPNQRHTGDRRAGIASDYYVVGDPQRIRQTLVQQDAFFSFLLISFGWLDIK